MEKDEEKVFLIFNTNFIGDILVNNLLCQNIKIFYPNSKVVYIVQPQFVDVAKYQKDVDDVIALDKVNKGGFWAVMKFIKEFPYKKPFASLIVYESDRNMVISKLIGTKHLLVNTNRGLKFLLTKEKYNSKSYEQIKDTFAGLLEPLTGEIKTDIPIVYNPPLSESALYKHLELLSKEKNLVLICPTSKRVEKDMKIKMALDLIKRIKDDNKIPLLTGAGCASKEFSKQLRLNGCFDFIDLVDLTDFVELANIIKLSKGVISVDTGTMHFANALQKPVVALFYDGYEKPWAPNETLYPAKTLSNEQSAEKIYNEFLTLVG